MANGHRGRVQALQKETFSKAVYVHCNELCTAAKVSGYVTTFFDILNNPHKFFHWGSKAHNVHCIAKGDASKRSMYGTGKIM